MLLQSHNEELGMTFQHRQTRTITMFVGNEERDVEIVCVYSVAPAEDEHGIFGRYVDDMYLEDGEGNRAIDVEETMSEGEWETLSVMVMEDHE